MATTSYLEEEISVNDNVSTPSISPSSGQPSNHSSPSSLDIQDSPTRSRHSLTSSEPPAEGTTSNLFTNTGLRIDEIPSEPFYSPVFQTALHSGHAIARGTHDAIQRVMGRSDKNAALNSFLTDAMSLSQNKTASVRTIAVIGDSGEGMFWSYRAIQAATHQSKGKSSVINSLLEFPEIAKTVRNQTFGTAENASHIA